MTAHVISTKSLHSAFVVLVAVLLISACPTGASAANVTIRSCHSAMQGEMGSNAGWSRSYYVPPVPLAPINACPQGLSFNSGVPVNESGSIRTGAWNFSSPRGLDLVSAKLTFAGGDRSTGLRYTVRDCFNCDVIAVVPDPLPSGAAQEMSIDFDERETFTVQADCVEAACAAVDSLRIFDIEIVVEDVTAPVVGVVAPPGVSNGWSRPVDAAMSLSVADRNKFRYWGVGVGSAQARIDEQPPFWSLPACNMLPSYSAPNLVSYFGYSLKCEDRKTHTYSGIADTRGLEDGVHRITLEASDAVGNVSVPASATFKLDSTPPEPPAINLLDEVNEFGWTNSNRLTVGWVNEVESFESTNQSGVWTAHYRLEPINTGETDATAVEGSASGDSISKLSNLTFPEEGLWRLRVRTTDRAGNDGGWSSELIGFDSHQPHAPTPLQTPWLNRAALIDGFQQGWQQPQNVELESGICGYSIATNATADSVPAAAITHPGTPLSAVLPANLPHGRSWFHARAISCAGIPSDTARVALNVDDVAPTLAIDGVPSTEWSRKPVQLTLTATDADSGPASIRRKLGSSSLQSFDGSTHKMQLPDGVHSLSYSASDVAGNVSPLQTRLVKVDSQAPRGVFAERDPARPSEIHARVDDSVSGVAVAQIEYGLLQQTGIDWRSLPTSSTSDLYSPQVQHLAARLPDESLADGVYAVRVVATDHAGNTSFSDTVEGRSDPMRLQLPIRSKYELTAGIAVHKRKCVRTKSRKRCRWRTTIDRRSAKRSTSVKYGTSASLVGELRDPSGNAVSQAILKVFSGPGDGTRTQVGTVRTDSRGAYRYKLPRGGNRRFTIQNEGSETILPSERHADVFVKAGVQFSARPRVVRVGKRVRFVGRLVGSGGAGPGNVLVVLEFRNGKRWQVTIGSTRTDRRGRFSIPYRFSQLAGRSAKVKVRAVAKSSFTAWPYLDGPSRAVTVRVRK